MMRWFEKIHHAFGDQFLESPLPQIIAFPCRRVVIVVGHYSFSSLPCHCNVSTDHLQRIPYVRIPLDRELLPAVHPMPFEKCWSTTPLYTARANTLLRRQKRQRDDSVDDDEYKIQVGDNINDGCVSLSSMTWRVGFLQRMNCHSTSDLNTTGSIVPQPCLTQLQNTTSPLLERALANPKQNC